MTAFSWSLERRLPWLLAPFAAAAGLLEIRAIDFFWHLAAGRWMLVNGAIPRVDPFRFTSPQGTEWVDHEWGFQLLLAAVEVVGGTGGLVLLRFAVVAALVAVLYQALRRRAAPVPVAVVLTVAAVVGARSRFYLRPELLSLLLFVVLLVGLEGAVSGRWRQVLALVTVVVVWANLHPAVLLAPVVSAVWVVANRLRRHVWRSEPAASGSAAALALPPLLAAAVLANPWGWELYLVPLRIRRALEGLPLSNPDWVSFHESPQPYLVLFATVTAVCVAAAVRRGWRIDLPMAAVAVALVPPVLASVRHQGFLFVVLALLCGSSAGHLAAQRTAQGVADGLRAAGYAAVAVLVAVGWCLWPPSRGPLRPRVRFAVGVAIAETAYPAAVERWLRSWPDVGNIFNSTRLGGYLLWRMYPPRQVFQDTRNEVNPALLREVATAREDSRAWRSLLDRYAIDAALVSYEGLRPVQLGPGTGRPVLRASSSLLFPPGEYALVRFDDVAMLFVRRSEAREARLEIEEYRYLHPEDVAGTVDRCRRDSAYRAAALAELSRALRQDPDCRRAQELVLAVME